MLGNQFLHFSLNFYDIGIRRLLQLRELIFAHGANHPVDVLIQLSVVDAVHLGQLLLDNALTQRKPLFRGLSVEPLPEKGAVASRQPPRLCGTVFAIVYIYPRHLSVDGGKIHMSVFIPQRESTLQVLQFQGFVGFRKQAGASLQHKLGEAQGSSFVCKFLIHSELIHFVAHLQRSLAQSGIFGLVDLVLIGFVLLQGL